MTDIVVYVAELLSPLGAQIELSYRDTDVTFPLIVLSVISDTARTTGKTEYWTTMSVQVDVYTLDKDSTYTAAQNVNELMTAGGFTRMNATPLTEGELERYTMTYLCNIDYTHNTIITI